MAVQVVILAAGQGTRMHSRLPKVLHQLAGKPMLERVILTASTISNKPPIIIYGHEGAQLQKTLAPHNITWIEQQQQLGTGHAVQQALPAINDKDQVLILYGDVPLISTETLQKLIDATSTDKIGMLTATLSQPTGYGRIKRDAQSKVISIIEEKDATAIERAITEINPGIYLVPAALLKKWLPMLHNNNAQKEYYLTDIISQAAKEKIEIQTEQPAMSEEIFGINDRVQLAQLERFQQRKFAEKLMRQGVTIIDPARLDIRGEVDIAQDVTLDINVILEGDVSIDEGSTIGANCILRDVKIGKHVEIKANSVIEGATIGAESIIGPFARIRPGTVLAANTHIGNFVEVKNSKIDAGSKINHLSYIGDSEIGKQVNIGAGTITCNYDGANKHKTIIQDNVHIGSDTQLVAPVTIGEGATIAAGSTIIKDVPPNELTFSHRLDLRSQNCKRPEKNK
jgi:bifunctional UDP-N-acetylglucosamine pyrophosphorylase/glucosamine-1-phosphate N-acetyltransferase